MVKRVDIQASTCERRTNQEVKGQTSPTPYY